MKFLIVLFISLLIASDIFASLDIHIPPPVRRIIAGTDISVDPVGGTGDVTINVTLPISVTGAVNGDCLIFNGSTGYFEPGSCGTVTTGDLWQLVSGELTPIVGTATDSLWNLSGNDISPSSGSTSDTYWQVVNGELTPL